MDLYARLLVSSCLICKFLRKKLKILLAFAVMLLMCVSHRVTMLYKIKHNLVAIDPNLYLVKQPIMHTRNSNILQYQLFNTRTNYFKFSYFTHSCLMEFFVTCNKHINIYIYIYILRQSINGDDYLSGAAQREQTKKL
jgi:hypothetical protein